MAYPTCITVDWSCMSTEELAAVDPAVKERAEHFAQLALRRLSAGQLGNCPITVRPCLSRGSGPVPVGGSPWMIPYVMDGVWYNSCGCAPRQCGCETLDSVILRGPVGEVLEVKVDGQALTPGVDYRIDNGNELVNLTDTPWPSRQDMSLADSEPGTMSVTYVRGLALDLLGQFIAGVLAKEYLDACNGNQCRLPANVTSVTRQGATLEVAAGSFPNNKSGIEEVDLYMESINPYAVTGMSAVYSPGRPQQRRTTWSV